MSIKCIDIVNKLEELAPKHLAYDWDNVGLLVGDHTQIINKVLISLDASQSVIEEAIKKNVDLIITHHPMIFKGIKQINTSSIMGEKVIKLIKNNISLYTAHTNLDAANSGVSDILANKLKLHNSKILNITSKEDLYKIVVFVPIDSVEVVRETLAKNVAGHIGNYSECTFSSKGIGTFKPQTGANPYIGEKDKLEYVEEVKLETIVINSKLKKVVSEMLKSHPYEEVAYDIYRLDRVAEEIGIGRVGELEEEMTLGAFVQSVKEQLELDNVRVVGNLSKKIKKVAVSPGSSMGFVKDAIEAKADVYVTGDIKYHEAFDMLEAGMPLIDAGHFGTENILLPEIKEYLDKYFGKDIEVNLSQVNKDPFTII